MKQIYLIKYALMLICLLFYLAFTKETTETWVGISEEAGFPNVFITTRGNTMIGFIYLNSNTYKIWSLPDQTCLIAKLEPTELQKNKKKW